MDVETYHQVFDQSPLAFAIIQLVKDDKGEPEDVEFVYVNQAAADIQRAEIGELLGKCLSELFSKSKTIWLDKIVDVALQKGDKEFSDYNPFTGRYNQIKCFCIQEGFCGCFIQDVTKTVERRKNEKINKRAKSDFLSRMSYDIRTPMNAIIGFSELGMVSSTKEEAQDYLKKIHESSENLQCIINDFLDMNKIGSGRMKLFYEPKYYEELMSDIKSVVLEKARKKNQKVIFSEYGTNRRRIFVDTLHLRQVLMNLLENAIRFTPEGGRIECITEFFVPVNGYLPVHFIIRDNGIGMSEDFIENELFCEFGQERKLESESENGVGLGLCIVHHLVELMNGTIQCVSELGKGTTFTVYFLARVEEEEVNEFQMQCIDDHILNGKRVLICEDRAINALLAEKILEKKSVISEWAKNGEVALEMYREHEAGYYDAIIMDVRMPVMDGLEATRQIRSLREDGKTIPIIAMTANAFSEDVEACKKAGMSEYLPKPIETQQMYATLCKVLR